MSQKLLEAAKQGDLDALIGALAEGANVDVCVSVSDTALFSIAANKGICSLLWNF